MNKISLQISDIKLIISELFIKTGHDFNNYAFSSIKHRFEMLMQMHNISNIDDFIFKIKNNNLFAEEIMYGTYAPYTEMFRDAETWNTLASNIFYKLRKKISLKIYIPQCTSGDELYTLMLMLEKANLLSKTKVYISAVSKRHLEFIIKAKYLIKKLSYIDKNFEILETKFDKNEIFNIEKDYFSIKNKFSKNIEFLKNDLFNDNSLTGNFDIVFFRNRILYFNNTLQNKAIDKIYDKLKKGGFLIVGIGENIGKQNYKRFKLIDKEENIFIKR